MYIKKRMSKTYRQEIENLTEKQLYDEILWHNIGDGEDGYMSKRCQDELGTLQEVFRERMIKLGLNWEEN